MKSKLLGILLAGAAFAAFGLVGTMDYEDELAGQDRYCEMVKMYRDSNGEKGWPDYNGNYNQACTD